MPNYVSQPISSKTESLSKTATMVRVSAGNIENTSITMKRKYIKYLFKTARCPGNIVSCLKWNLGIYMREIVGNLLNKRLCLKKKLLNAIKD